MVRRSRVEVRRQVPVVPAVLLVLVAVPVLAAQEESHHSLVGGQPALAVAPAAVRMHAPGTARTPGPLRGR